MGKQKPKTFISRKVAKDPKGLMRKEGIKT